jgi:tetratricopeptide (TPR) repeat protein
LRIQIDPSFRAAQPPQTQLALQKSAERLLGAPVVPALRAVQAALASGDGLAEPFRLAEGAVQLLRQETPHLVPRLAQCFYWALVSDGLPADDNRYQKLFGMPPEDPGLARMHALASERNGYPRDASEHWREFEAAVAAHPGQWRLSESEEPLAQANRIRALLWERIGQQLMEPAEDGDGLQAECPRSARDVEACLRKSIHLAPDRSGPYLSLFHHYLNENKAGKAEEVGQQFLERFPGQPRILEQLGDVRMQGGQFDKAMELYEQALAQQPLNNNLRSKSLIAQLEQARALSKVGRIDEARPLFAALRAQDSTVQRYQFTCQSAIGEFLAGDVHRAGALLEEARNECGSRLAVAYYMLADIVSFSLPRSLKTRWDKEFADALAEPPDARGIVTMLQIASCYRMTNDAYHGRGAHEKKVLKYVEKATQLDYSEAQLESITRSLAWLEAQRLCEKFARPAERRYPRNPVFPLQRARAYLAGTNIEMARQQLNRARELATQLPPNENQQQILVELEQLSREAQEADRSMSEAFREAFNRFFGEAEDEEPRRRRPRSR